MPPLLLCPPRPAWMRPATCVPPHTLPSTASPACWNQPLPHVRRAAELERELERDREAVRGKPASRADEQRERRREQVALNEQAKQEEAAQQRLQAAVQHAFTVSLAPCGAASLRGVRCRGQG